MAVTINASTSAGLVNTADTSGVLALQTAGTTAVTVDASQNVGIGTASPQARLHESSTNDGVQAIFTGAQTGTTQSILLRSQYHTNNGTAGFANIGWIDNGAQGGSLTLGTASNGGGTTGIPTERMRIDSSGNLLVGTTNTSLTAGVGLKFIASATEPYMAYVVNTAAVASNFHLYNTNATNNGFRFYVNTNGGIANYSANNTNLSDERTKTDIQNAGNYLAKICAIPVRTFKYKDQADDLLNLGVIAQEVESIAPELVDVLGFGETPKDGIPLKSIYQTDLQYALMKCIQEQQALIQSLTDRITALETP